jgi:uncharacterized protein Yka (UPF0111/DUF47 family)
MVDGGYMVNKERLEQCFMDRKELALTMRRIESLGENSPLLQQLIGRSASIAAKIKAVEAYIDTIDSSIVRQILTLRYVEGLTIKEIGAYVGYSSKTVSRFLKKHFMET